MALSLNSFPDKVLDTLLRHVFEANPLLRLGFLASLGSRMHASAARVLVGNLAIEDDMRIYSSFDASALGPVAALLHNAARYGPTVRRLTVHDPTCFDNFEPRRARDSSPLLRFGSFEGSEDEEEDTARGLIEPLSSDRLYAILAACCNLTELVWLSATPPPDGLCETLASYNAKLTLLAFTPEASLIPLSPQIPAHARIVPPRWDAPSLGLLAGLPISKLHLSRLSQSGARSLAGLLSDLGENSTLEEVILNFLWLDDSLCDKLIDASKKLRRLRLTTNGTKLTDRGLLAILDNVDTLEELELVEVEGRLSKKLWEKADLPASMTRLTIRTSEAGPHHSWVTDHFSSLSSLSFASLTVIRFMRTFHPFDSRFDDVAVLQSLPSELAVSLKAAKRLEVLECDWWTWSSENLKVVLDSCNNLQVLRIAFGAPFIKLLTLTSVFAPAPLLRELHVYVSPSKAPLMPTAMYSHPLTPSASPVVSSTATLPTACVSDSPPMHSSSSFDDGRAGGVGAELDPHLPPLREVKKFVRRCQALTQLEWYGWNGRGSWVVTRPPGATKSTINVSVEHMPPSPPALALLQKYALEEEATRVGWFPGSLPREGQSWTGPLADKYFSERQAEKEKDDIATPAKTKSRKASGNSSSRMDSPLEMTNNLPLTPAASAKAFSPPPLTPLKIGKESVAAAPLSPKSPPATGRHRRSTTESFINGDSGRSNTAASDQGASGRRKSVGSGAGRGAGRGNASGNGSYKPSTGSRQNRSETAKGRGGKTAILSKSTSG